MEIQSGDQKCAEALTGAAEKFVALGAYRNVRAPKNFATQMSSDGAVRAGDLEMLSRIERMVEGSSQLKMQGCVLVNQEPFLLRCGNEIE